MNPADPGFGIYVHWPFCRSKCPYCDFNSVAAGDIDQARWRNALLGELAHAAGTAPGRTVTSVFFGGGTPSLMDAHTAGAVIAAAGRHWRLAETLEVTIEANPTTAESGRFAAFAAAGVNRLSLGVQSLDDRALAFLGRTHDAAQARRALALAGRHFGRFSFDLIYGLPQETAADWRSGLREAVGLAGGHVSAYQLTVEPGTPFHRDGIGEADEETAAALFDVTQAVLEDAGLPAYEISNHARPGDECRHNLTCWQGGDYVGIGPGAHGRVSVGGETRATCRVADPPAWLAAVEANGHGTAEAVSLNGARRREEMVMTGLRLSAGIDRVLFRRLAGIEPEAAVRPGGLARLVDGGFLVADGAGLRTTKAGRVRLNAVISALLA